MRSRGGGVLSASALVALGTSVLLVALIGLGLSELAGSRGDGATGVARAEAAAVVVPDVTAKRHAAVGKDRHPSINPRPSIPVLTPSAGHIVTTTAPPSGGSTAAATVRRTPTHARSTSTPKVTSPTPSPTRAHGRGKGNGGAHGHAPGGPHGHTKPAKP